MSAELNIVGLSLIWNRYKFRWHLRYPGSKGMANEMRGDICPMLPPPSEARTKPQCEPEAEEGFWSEELTGG